MPRPCRICSHPRRGEIDAEIIAGQPHRGISSRWATKAHPLSKTSVMRHRDNCLPSGARAAVAAVKKQAETRYQAAVEGHAKTMVERTEEAAARLAELEHIATEMVHEVRSVMADKDADVDAKLRLVGKLLGALEQAISANSAGQGWARLWGQATGQLDRKTKVELSGPGGGPVKIEVDHYWSAMPEGIRELRAAVEAGDDEARARFAGFLVSDSADPAAQLLALEWAAGIMRRLVADVPALPVASEREAG